MVIFKIILDLQDKNARILRCFSVRFCNFSKSKTFGVIFQIELKLQWYMQKIAFQVFFGWMTDFFQIIDFNAFSSVSKKSYG